MFRSFAEQGIAVFAYDQRGFGATAAATKTQGVTSWPQQLNDISWAVNHASNLHPGTPLVMFGHSMGGGLSLAFATRSPASPGLDKVAAVVSSSPLLRQSPGVKASALLIKAGSLLGKLSGKLTLSAPVNPEVSFITWARPCSQLTGTRSLVSRTYAATLKFRRPTPRTRCVNKPVLSVASQTCFWA